MTLDKLDHHKTEEKWQKKWDADKTYSFDEHSEKPVYDIDTPPPFPTGEFHTGSTLNWCYIDFAARFKRMNGFNVLFPQGWDCHGFPTEVKVEQKHGRLPRDEFRKKCLEWTHDMVGSIKAQMKQMGFSIDWKHEYFTTDKEYHRKVQYSLLKMFEQGLVYHAEHPVMFCTNCASAIAKAETDDIERETVLNTIEFKTEAGNPLLIATTRPEMLHSCVAVFVHPEDERYKQLIGLNALVPLYDKKVPIIADADVDK